MRNIRNNKKGFSLAEVMMVVAILMILASVTFVSVSTYIRKFKLTDFDHTAQEIYVAAQYHLSVSTLNHSMDKLENTDDKKPLGIEDDLYNGSYYVKDIESETDISTIIYDPDNFNESTPGYEVWRKILPQGAVEETIRTNGSYMITYDKASGYVLGVFYSLPGGNYGYKFDESVYKNKKEILKTAMAYQDGNIEADKAGQSKYVRRHFDTDKKIVGFYGGQDIETIGKTDGKDITVTLENGNILTARVSVKDTKITKDIADGKDTIKLSIKGNFSNQRADIYWDGIRTIKLDSLTDGVEIKNEKHEVIGKDYTFVLDDYSKLNGLSTFNQQFAKYGLIPGEDITVSATIVQKKNKVNVSKESNSAVTNSIYASFVKDPSTTKNEGTVGIANVRHLENLSYKISGINTGADASKKLVPKVANQISNIAWDQFVEDMDLGEQKFEPIATNYTLDYEGHGYVLTRLRIDAPTDSKARSYSDGDAGLFGTIGLRDEKGNIIKGGNVGLTVNELSVDDVIVGAHGNGDAGAIIGQVNQVSGDVILTNILVYGKNAIVEADVDHPDGVGSTSVGASAGGIIGSYRGSYEGTDSAKFTISQCGVSSLVRGSLRNVPKTESDSFAIQSDSWNTAGGIMGYFCPGSKVGRLSVLIENSYVGGRTWNGEYLEKINYSTTEPGWNVTAGNTTGGLFGTIRAQGFKSFLIQNCYTTASAYSDGKDTGGIVGYIDKVPSGGYLNMKSVYAAGKVASAKNGNNGIGHIAGVNHLDDDWHYEDIYYLGGQTAKNRERYKVAEKTCSNGTEVDAEMLTQDEMFQKAKSLKQSTRAVPFDPRLGTAYPYPNWTTTRANTTEKKNTHYGDWITPNRERPIAKIVNEEVLQVVVSVKDSLGQDDVSIMVYPEGAENSARTFKFEEGHVASDIGSIAKVVKTETGYDYIITLDDITTAGKHFAEIIDGIQPGETFEVTATVNGINSDRVAGNSIYADASDSKTAVISNGRHLQNLDTYISGNNLQTVARQSEDIDWSQFLTNVRSMTGRAQNEDVFIYANGKTDPANTLANVFDGIVNDSINEYAGDDWTISNLVIDNTNNTVMNPSDDTQGSNFDAGLFRKSNGINIHNLRLHDISVNTVNGNAGAFIGELHNGATVEFNSILVDGENTFIAATGTGQNVNKESIGRAGGLVGYAKANLTINSSASAVYVYGGEHAGGLVGQTAGNLTVNESYAAGHTSNGKYLMTHEGVGRYNVDSETGHAGGIVGRISGDFSMKNSFAANSVYSNQSAGGIFGRASKAVSFTGDNYAIGLVQSKDNSRSGAFTGISDESYTLGNNTYYLADIYNQDGVQEINPIADNKATGGTPNEAYYTDSLTTGIAARNDLDHLQYRTYTYDSTLKANKYEYPFKLWTKFAFSGLSNMNLCYFGDWQPVNRDTTPKYAYFKYMVPGSNELQDLPSTISRQRIQLYKENSVVAPSAPKVKGYKLEGWYLYDESAGKLGEKIGDADAIKLTLAKPRNNVIIVPQYTKIITHTVSFLYKDPSSEGDWSDLIDPQEIEDGEDANVPSKTIEGYTFRGWYDAPTGGNEVQESTFKNVKNDITVYARYKKLDYYLITVDFMLLNSNGDEVSLGVAPYKIRILEGQKYDDTLGLPVAQNEDLKVETSSKTSGNSNASIAINGNELKLTADSQSSFKVVYKGETDSVKSKYTVKEVFEHSSPVDGSFSINANDKYTEVIRDQIGFAGNTTGVKPREVEGFTAKPYVDQIIAADGSTVVTIEYERNLHTISFDSAGGTIVQPIMRYFDQPMELPSSLNPSRTGYMFGGWKYSYKYENRSASAISESMPDSEVMATATWNPANANYTIVYMIENADDNGYSYLKSSTATGLTGKGAALGNEQTNPVSVLGKEAAYYSYNEEKTNNELADVIIAGDGSTVVKVYYLRNTFTLSFVSNITKDRVITCQIEEHRHSINCYTGVTDIKGAGKFLKLLEILFGGTPQNGTVSISGKNVYLYYNGWKNYSGKYTLTGTDKGIATRTCGKEEHTHSEQNGCYEYVNSAGGYYRQPETIKYGAAIYNIFSENIIQSYYWQDADGIFEYVLQTLDRMPGRNLTLVSVGTNTGEHRIEYYVQRVGSVINNVWPQDQNEISKYQLQKTVLSNFAYTTYDEEYHEIEGFERYSQEESGYIQRSRNNNDEIVYNAKYWDYDGNLRLYYKRKSFDLDYVYKDVSLKQVSVQYEDSLKKKLEYVPIRPNDIPDTYEFSGWYTTPECTPDTKADDTLFNMPASNVRLYAKWTPPTYHVNFDMNTGGIDSSASMTGSTSFDVLGYTTLESQSDSSKQITDDQGNLKDSFKPTVSKDSDYEFTGWATKNADGTFEPFVYSSYIEKDTTLYAQWEKVRGKSKLTIKHIANSVDENGETVLDTLEEEEVSDLTIGETYTANSKEFTGYFTMNPSKKVVIDADDNQSVTLYYNKSVSDWDYTVEYYVNYRASSNADGAQDVSKNHEVLISSEKIHASEKVVPVEFKMPSGFSNYRVVGEDIKYAQNKEGSEVVKFYIEPDFTEMEFKGTEVEYDGLPHEVKATDYSVNNTLVDATITNEIHYYSGEDHTEVVSPTEAGVYTFSSQVVATIDGKKYVLYEASEDTEHRLIIRKRKVVLQSKSANKQYDGKVLTASGKDDVTVVDGSWADGQGVESYKFTVDAFRFDIGVSENKFEIDKFMEGTNEDNYDITYNYGTLTITGKFSVILNGDGETQNCVVDTDYDKVRQTYDYLNLNVEEFEDEVLVGMNTLLDAGYIKPIESQSGFVFKGWYTDKELTQPWNPIHEKVSGNIELYADFRAPEWNYSITYEMKFTDPLYLAAVDEANKDAIEEADGSGEKYDELLKTKMAQIDAEYPNSEVVIPMYTAEFTSEAEKEDVTIPDGFLLYDREFLGTQIRYDASEEEKNITIGITPDLTTASVLPGGDVTATFKNGVLTYADGEVNKLPFSIKLAQDTSEDEHGVTQAKLLTMLKPYLKATTSTTEEIAETDTGYQRYLKSKDPDQALVYAITYTNQLNGESMTAYYMVNEAGGITDAAGTEMLIAGTVPNVPGTWDVTAELQWAKVQKVQKTDETGQPVYDEAGNPVKENAVDESGNLIYDFYRIYVFDDSQKRILTINEADVLEETNLRRVMSEETDLEDLEESEETTDEETEEELSDEKVTSEDESDPTDDTSTKGKSSEKSDDVVSMNTSDVTKKTSDTVNAESSNTTNKN